jgi:hypothetical protein
VVVVVVSTEEGSAVAVSTVAVLVVDSTVEASAVARSTAVVVSVEDVSAVAVSTAVAFVGDVSALAVSTAVAFVATVLVITDFLMMSSSAASAFRVGGAGDIRTDITVMATTITHTITMAMETDTDTDGTVTTVGPVTDTAMAADQGIPEVCGGDDKLGYGSLVSGLSACTSIRHRTAPRSSMQFQIVSAPSFFVGSASLTCSHRGTLQSDCKARPSRRMWKANQTGEPDE